MNSRKADQDQLAQDTIFRMLLNGRARVERTGSVREFCFNGMRYSITGDWEVLVNIIGWAEATAAANDK